jgi:hypothetical protein
MAPKDIGGRIAWRRRPSIRACYIDARHTRLYPHREGLDLAVRAKMNTLRSK